MRYALLPRILLGVVFSLILTPLAFAQIIPPPPQPVSKQAVARCNSRVKGYSKKTDQDPQQIPYSPQAGWAIVSYRVVDEGAFGTTTKNWTSVPGNYTFSSSADVTSTYNSAINMAVSAGIKGKQLADFKAELKNSYDAYNAYHNSIAAGQATIIMQTNAKGNGIVVSTGSAVAMHLDVVEIQVDTNLKTAAAFNAFVIEKTKQKIALLQKSKLLNQRE